MDLLFNRYASPFLILDQMIDAGRFSEFINELYKIQNEETDNKTIWEYYLHHSLLTMGFDEFKRTLGVSTGVPEEPEKKANIETTISSAYDMLNGFVPE